MFLYKFTLLQMTMSSGTGGDTSSVSSDRAGSVGSGISVPPSSSLAGMSNYSGAIQRPTDLPLRHSTNDNVSNNSSRGGIVADALSRHSGNSSSSVNSTKPPTSPSNSGKSNTLPGRGSSSSSHFDPSSQPEGMQLYKVIRGNTTSSQPGSTKSDAQDQLEHLDRFDRIRAEIMSGGNMNLHSASIGGMTVQRGASVGGGGRGHGGTTGVGGAGGPAGTGSNSLGSATKYAANLESHLVNAEKRRRSAGDEDLMKQMNVYLRTRTGSGKNLTDLEILSQVPVKNLDTGENFPLSAVEENIPGGTDLNPLSLHILRLTSHLEIRESDDESVCGSSVRGGGGAGSENTIPTLDDDEGEVEEGGRLRRKTAKLRRFFGSTVRKTVDKAKSIASEVSHARHKEDVADIVDAMNPEQNIKIKASSSNKGPYEFTKLQHVQDLGEAARGAGGGGTSSSGACGPDGSSQSGTGAVWCMKFSSCGRLLATAGQDKVLKIWVLKDAYPFFQDMRTKYNAEQKASPTPSQESLVSHNSAEEALAMAAAAESCPGPFMPRAFCSYTGHTSDLLDVAWSKNYFILSSSMDKTVRLWHISRRECLCSFQHIDFVTAIAFHPRDDRFFLSGSLDGKLRLWNIPDKKVALYTELNGPTKLITAANFCQNGKFAVVGSYDGRCIFYTTDQLRYHTMVHVRSSRGRNKTARKISGIEPMPGEDKILVTSNDSRVRLYDLRDLNLSCKYKGFVNASSQIKASFSHDGKYVIAGSENQCIYVWKTHNDQSKLGSGLRRDRSDYWEGIKAHNATVTCAIFAPHPEAIIKPEMDNEITDTTVSGGRFLFD